MKEPWQGSGRDPRNDKWANTEPGEDDDDDEDSGEEIDRSTYHCPFSYPLIPLI